MDQSGSGGTFADLAKASLLQASDVRSFLRACDLTQSLFDDSTVSPAQTRSPGGPGRSARQVGNDQVHLRSDADHAEDFPLLDALARGVKTSIPWTLPPPIWTT